ncbi:MAG: aldehyde dehydrogenase family protein [Candidatus Omnitrophota bacterium]
MDKTIYKNYLDGKWRDSSSGKKFPDINPADREEVIGYFQQSNIQDIKEAIESAGKAFEAWKRYPPQKRAQVLSQALLLLKKRKERLARDLTREEGKTLRESEAEIDSAIKEMGFQIGEGERIFGKTSFSEKAQTLSYTMRQPLGVVSILSPWNFPVNVPCRKIVPALVAGNTVVFKPASFTPLSGLRFVEIFIDAGLPKGVLNFVTGSGSEIGDEMVANSAVKAVSFTGSTEVGMRINSIACRNMTKVQLEMGGKNPAVVLEDADLETASDSILFAAYACSGQWCTSTSRLILVEEIADRFIKILVKKVRKINPGNGLDPQTSMGPLAGETQMKRVMDYIAIGKQEGAKILVGGKKMAASPREKGFFVEPTVFVDVKPEMRIAREEIFGPVLSVIKVKSFEEALEVANKVRFGLSSSIYTNDVSRALRFIEESRVGISHLNLPTSYKETHLPFGGIKDSGFGLPEAGETGIEFFTENKSVYLNYGDR